MSSGSAAYPCASDPHRADVADSGRDDSYVASSLAEADAKSYRSAGIMLYDFQLEPGHKSGERGLLRLFLGRNHSNNVEFLSGKKEQFDADVFATAAREFDEESGGVFADSAGDISHRATLMRACRSSKVLWCG